MAYTPVSQRQGVTGNTGYVPVSGRSTSSTPTPTDYTGTLGDLSRLPQPSFAVKTSTQAIPDETTGSTATVLKGVAQGLARIPADFAVTAGQAGLSIADKLNGTTYTQKAVDTGAPTGNLSWLFGDEPIKGYASEIVNLSQKIQDSPLAQKYGVDKAALPLAFGTIVPLEALNFFGGEADGAKAFMRTAQKIPNTAEGVADAYKLMRGAGFEHDVAAQYAPLFAKEVTAQGTQKITEAAVKLQNTTKPAAYMPVADRLGATTQKGIVPSTALPLSAIGTVQEAKTKLSTIFDPHEMDFLFPEKIKGQTVSTEGLYTPARAFKNPLIQVVQKGGQVEDATLFHEAFHGYLDRFVSPTEKELVLKAISKNIATVPARISLKLSGYTWKQTAEEWAADDFARYVAGKKSLAANQSTYQKILTHVREWIRKTTGLQSVYDHLLTKDRSVVNPRTNSGLSSLRKISDKKPSQIEQDLANMKQAITYTKETVSDMPGKQLVRYVSRETGALPEQGAKTANKNASKSLFAQKGDAILQNILGQDVSKGGDVSHAQQLLQEYQSARAGLKRMENEYKQAKLEHRTQKVIDAMGIKLEKARQALIGFNEKYPRLYEATQRLSEAEVRGAKVGYRVGQQVERAKVLDALRVKQENTSAVRTQIVDYARQNLPLNERGKLITLIRDAKTQRDLTQAFVRIDNKVREVELSKAITDLRNTADKLAESPSVSADYRNKIKGIVDQYELTGHTSATISKLEATQAYLDKAVAAGEDTNIPQRLLDKLKILTRTPKDKLTLTQVQGLQNEVELLGKLGKTKWATKQALYEGEKDLRKQALLDSATPLNSSVLPKKEIGSKPKFWAERYIAIRNYFQKTRVGLTPIEGLADVTGMQPMKEAIDLNFGNYLVHNAESDAKWLDLTKTFTSKEYERIGAYAISKQAGGLERLANSGISKAEVDAIILTADEQKAYQFVRDTFESEYPAVKKYAMDTYNADVGQVDNYVSFMSDYNAMSDLEIYDRFGQRAEEAVSRRTKTVEQGFTKERAAVANNKLELNIDKIFSRHTDDVAYMLNMGHEIKQYSEIVNSPEMRAKLGDTGALAWMQYLDVMARKGGAEGAKRIAALDIVRKNIGSGILGFRISSALVQFTSFADTIATVGAEAATRGATRIATSKEWRNFIMDNFPEVKKAVGDDIAFREFGDSFWGKAQQKGMTPLQTLDGVMRSTAAAAAYEKLALERGIKIDLAHPNKQLIAEATKTMRQSQGSSFFKDQPLALTSGYGLTDNKSLNKTILTFQSFMLNRWDNMQRQIWRLGIKEGDYKKAASAVFWMVIFSAAMEEGIRRGTRAAVNFVTGDSQPEQSFVGNAVSNVLQTVPIAGSLVSAMTYSSNPVPVINTFEDLLAGAGSVMNGKAGNTKARGAVQALGAGGALLGIPGSSQAAQLIRKSIPQASGGSSSGSSTTKKFKPPTGLPSLPSLKLPSPPGLPKLPSP